MIRAKFFAVIGAAAFAASSGFAGDKAACCAGHAGNEAAKEGCEMTFANLNLNDDQKAKMEKLAAECHKGGCTEATMAKMDKEAGKILSKDQYATWKSSHSTHKSGEKTQS